jgi:hypothetical protein
MDQLIAVVVDESKWLTASMTVATAAVLLLQLRQRRPLPARTHILAAMNLFFGVTIGTMAAGHLLAVTTKLAIGTLEGPVVLFYLIGIALAVPSWLVAYHTRRIVNSPDSHGRSTLQLNGWLVLTLAVLGLANLPLAVPGLLTIGYHLHTRRVVGWAIVSVALVVNLGLLVGSVIFLASGQSFEQFRGIE